MGQWRWRDAIAIADRWLAGDPLSDDAVRLAIEARYLAGDRGAALGRYQQYRATLLQETGCEPSRGLLNLIRRVEADVSPINARPMTDEWYARAPSFEARLIGRENEWGSLLETLERGETRPEQDRAAGGGGRRREIAPGRRVSPLGRGQCRQCLPGPRLRRQTRHSLRAGHGDAARCARRAGTGRCAPRVAGRSGSPAAGSCGSGSPLCLSYRRRSDTSSAWRLFEGVAQVILALAAERPLVVSIDDMQWCDGESCDLLRYLVRRTEEAPVLWLGTLSSGEVERDAPSVRLCRVLRAKSQAAVISVQPLREEELWRMIHEMGHVSTPTGARRFANRIYGVTAGNPFYVIELLKTMFAQGLLAVDDETGEWTVSPQAMSQQGREFPCLPDGARCHCGADRTAARRAAGNPHDRRSGRVGVPLGGALARARHLATARSGSGRRPG